ncbi:Zinc finger 813 [Solea senegalensis]|uniref:Zinc finger 813 n=1 Tax=Solea senegalensis TaxID=28829 RepID=A0AAV6T607_SOLSE|nr:zinc finger protein 273-like isoform X1 [Solea senegalensis]KAG7524601.1 Zinc finger 813 [Solea senegalensis]
MCSIAGCESWRRSAQRFTLPEDPEKRLEWVQFVLEVNGQRLKESSWTDISVCGEHFTHDCLEYKATSSDVQLKPGAVPSLCIKSDPEDAVDIFPQCAVPEYVETTEITCQRDDLETVSGTVTSGCGQNEQNVWSSNLIRKKIPHFQIKGKHFVNESCLLQLFRHKCPSCDCKLHMEKVTYGPLIVINQQCLQCEYRFQWKSQINAKVPAAEDIPPVTQKLLPTDDFPSSAGSSGSVSLSDEEKDSSDEVDEEDEGDEEGMSSDGEWNPTEESLLAKKLTKDSEEESEDEGKEGEGDKPQGGLKMKELCTECGSFVNTLKSHTCEHKSKPYSCRICGKRCVNEMSLRRHNMIHSETYEHPCKYCHVTFRTRVDKLKHEQIHKKQKRPYKCPDCPEKFASRKERCVHLPTHGGEKEIKCGVCGFKFKNLHRLQRHSFVHTGLKPYQCPVCERGFNQAGNLKSHMRLHTGEKPFKCQHCDKCFNHNVSLKSHVQRYHASSSGHGRKEGEINERPSDTGTDSESDNLEREQDTGEELQKMTAEMPNISMKPTGRPKGRPKSATAGDPVLTAPNKDKCSKRKSSKSKAYKSKGSDSSAEESERDQINSSSSDDSEDEEENPTTQRSMGRKRKRPKHDSDSDFHPGNEKGKRKSSSSFGRQRKNVVL